MSRGKEALWLSLGATRMMQNQSDTIRLMAQKYLQLAKTADDPQERAKFLNYAALYGDLFELGAIAVGETVSGKKRSR